MEISEARKKIENAIFQDGNYTNNIIGSVLRQVARDHGYGTANQLIDEYDIEEEYGIPPVMDKG